MSILRGGCKKCTFPQLNEHIVGLYTEYNINIGIGQYALKILHGLADQTKGQIQNINVKNKLNELSFQWWGGGVPAN